MEIPFSSKTAEAVPSSASDTTTSGSSTDSSSTASPTPEKKQKPKDTYQLHIELQYPSVPPLTGLGKLESRQRLRSVDNIEKQKRLREEARNSLESYIYRLSDLLQEDNAQTPFYEFSKAEERQLLRRKLDDVVVWLGDAGEDADTAELWSKRGELEAIERPIQNRNMEYSAAPQAVQDLQQAIYAGRVFLASARENMTLEAATGIPSKYTIEELEKIEKQVNEIASWLEEGIKKQNLLPKNEDPVLLEKDLRTRGVAMQKDVLKLLRRKAPKVKPSSSSSEGSSSTRSTSSTSSGTTASAAEETVHDEL